MRVIALLLFVIATGCHVAGETVIDRPPSEGAVPENRVLVPNLSGDEALLELPRGTLTSEAELRHLDRRRACFDVILRTWRGAGPTWRVSLVTDRGVVGSTTWTPRRCVGGSCESYGFTISERPTDSLPMVRAVGGRACFDSRDLDLREARTFQLQARQGAYIMSFSWLI